MATPTRFEVLFTVLSPAAVPGANDTLWCFVKRWDVPLPGVQSAAEAGGAGGSEDKAADPSGGAGSEEASPVRTEWQTLGAVLLWSTAVCTNKDLVRVQTPRDQCAVVIHDLWAMQPVSEGRGYA